MSSMGGPPYFCGPRADGKINRWKITSTTLGLLEQVFKIERFPSLHMRQRLAADIGVSSRQARAPPANICRRKLEHCFS